ncbi:DUF4249 domain-containing protein [Belliella sp. DSM 111904]|uniref:DUF4249 domain-containing protein n=1 Tax=Belliella filtrata TaxID=2923435 RepID=A0ABS9V551_9BACT|nr:DUF4249 domain-containing protein [Belliella filtrata]MCH7411315.1 DUF4249 domain-containing protein [Belliella filtrata]
MKKHNIIVLISLLILTVSCVDVIDMQINDYEPYVVIDGEIQDISENQEIKISISQPYLKEGEIWVSGAEIELFENGNSLGFYKEVKAGTYMITLVPTYGNKYHIEITLPELTNFLEFSYQKIISIPELFKEVTPIESIGYEFRQEKAGVMEEGYYVFIDTFDPVGLGDFYQWKLEKNGKLFNLPSELTLLSDELVDGNQLHDLFFFERFDKGDTVTVYQSSLSKNYYKFLEAVYTLAVSQGGLFEIPGYNPTPNLKAEIPIIGYFNASSYSKATVIIEE